MQSECQAKCGTEGLLLEKNLAVPRSSSAPTTPSSGLPPCVSFAPTYSASTGVARQTKNGRTFALDRLPSSASSVPPSPASITPSGSDHDALLNRSFTALSLHGSSRASESTKSLLPFMTPPFVSCSSSSASSSTANTLAPRGTPAGLSAQTSQPSAPALVHSYSAGPRGPPATPTSTTSVRTQQMQSSQWLYRKPKSPHVGPPGSSSGVMTTPSGAGGAAFGNEYGNGSGYDYFHAVRCLTATSTSTSSVSMFKQRPGSGLSTTSSTMDKVIASSTANSSGFSPSLVSAYATSSTTTYNPTHAPMFTLKTSSSSTSSRSAPSSSLLSSSYLHQRQHFKHSSLGSALGFSSNPSSGYQSQDNNDSGLPTPMTRSRSLNEGNANAARVLLSSGSNGVAVNFQGNRSDQCHNAHTCEGEEDMGSQYRYSEGLHRNGLDVGIKEYKFEESVEGEDMGSSISAHASSASASEHPTTTATTSETSAPLFLGSTSVSSFTHQPVRSQSRLVSRTASPFAFPFSSSPSPSAASHALSLASPDPGLSSLNDGSNGSFRESTVALSSSSTASPFWPSFLRSRRKSDRSMPWLKKKNSIGDGAITKDKAKDNNANWSHSITTGLSINLDASTLGFTRMVTGVGAKEKSKGKEKEVEGKGGDDISENATFNGLEKNMSQIESEATFSTGYYSSEGVVAVHSQNRTFSNRPDPFSRDKAELGFTHTHFSQSASGSCRRQERAPSLTSDAHHLPPNFDKVEYEAAVSYPGSATPAHKILPNTDGGKAATTVPTALSSSSSLGPLSNKCVPRHGNPSALPYKSILSAYPLFPDLIPESHSHLTRFCSANYLQRFHQSHNRRPASNRVFVFLHGHYE